MFKQVKNGQACVEWNQQEKFAYSSELLKSGSRGWDLIGTCAVNSYIFVGSNCPGLQTKCLFVDMWFCGFVKVRLQPNRRYVLVEHLNSKSGALLKQVFSLSYLY